MQTTRKAWYFTYCMIVWQIVLRLNDNSSSLGDNADPQRIYNYLCRDWSLLHPSNHVTLIRSLSSTQHAATRLAYLSLINLLWICKRQNICGSQPSYIHITDWIVWGELLASLYLEIHPTHHFLHGYKKCKSGFGIINWLEIKYIVRFLICNPNT